MEVGVGLTVTWFITTTTMMLMMLLMMLMPLAALTQAQDCDKATQVRSVPHRSVVLPCDGPRRATTAAALQKGSCSVESVTWFRVTSTGGRVLVFHLAGPSPPANASGVEYPARDPPVAVGTDRVSLVLADAVPADGGRYRCACRLTCAGRTEFSCDEVSFVVTEECDMATQVRSVPHRSVVLPCDGPQRVAAALPKGSCSVESVTWFRVTSTGGRVLVFHLAGPSPPANASGVEYPARYPPVAVGTDKVSLVLADAVPADGGRYRCACRLTCAGRTEFSCDEVLLVVTEDGRSTTSPVPVTAASVVLVTVVVVVVAVVAVLVVAAVVGIVLAVRRCKRNRRASNQETSLQENDYATLGPQEIGYSNLDPQRLRTGLHPPAGNYENFRSA
ncbi:uncharacterized protein LOC144954307 isoform X1 [Lampetra fluviatilis]